jgi:hypothetical protein
VQTDSPTVSPGLDRPGLDPDPAPEPALHLLAGLWVASCPTCGYQLTTARTASSNGPRSVYVDVRGTCPSRVKAGRTSPSPADCPQNTPPTRNE